MAKLYRLSKDGRYIKVGDFLQQSYTFEIKECSFEFDFAKIWA
jgi:hypothetical protein